MVSWRGLLGACSGGVSHSETPSAPDVTQKRPSVNLVARVELRGPAGGGACAAGFAGGDAPLKPPKLLEPPAPTVSLELIAKVRGEAPGIAWRAGAQQASVKGRAAPASGQRRAAGGAGRRRCLRCAAAERSAHAAPFARVPPVPWRQTPSPRVPWHAPLSPPNPAGTPPGPRAAAGPRRHRRPPAPCPPRGRRGDRGARGRRFRGVGAAAAGPRAAGGLVRRRPHAQQPPSLGPTRGISPDRAAPRPDRPAASLKCPACLQTDFARNRPPARPPAAASAPSATRAPPTAPPPRASPRCLPRTAPARPRWSGT